MLLHLLAVSVALAATPLVVEVTPDSLTMTSPDGTTPLLQGQALPGVGRFELTIDIDMDGLPEFEIRPGFLQNVRATAWYSRSHTGLNRMPTFEVMRLWPNPADQTLPPMATLTRGAFGRIHVQIDTDQDGEPDGEAIAPFGW